MKLASWTIGTRLGVSHALLLTLLAIVTFCGYRGLQQTNAALHDIADVNVKKIQLAHRMAVQTHIVSRVIRSIALLNDEAAAAVEQKRIDDATQAYQEASATLARMPLNAEELRLLADINRQQAHTQPLNQQFLRMSHEQREDAIKFLLAQVRPANSAWLDRIYAFTALQESGNLRDLQDAESAFRDTVRRMLILAGAALLLGAGVSWRITRSITTPLASAVTLAQAAASGDLSSSLAASGSDEAGQLLRALGGMNAGLGGIVEQVRFSADSITASAADIASGNLDLARRTERQASSLEQTSSSVEAMARAAQQSAQRANTAQLMATRATETALRGGAAVAEMTATMEAIDQHSERIVDIISVIDSIAFQTGILALNAAVEAAHAGDQGRGFAVVAAEVRGLAQRSATAAGEIKALINDSVFQAARGAQAAGQAGQVMSEVVQSIRDVGALITELTIASETQRGGIDLINLAVCELDALTQQNAALAQQVAGSAAAMRSAASQLTQRVAAFKTRVGDSTAPGEQPPAALAALPYLA